MGAKIIVGLMGPGETATPEQNEDAFELGAAIAKQGWILLTGGRAFGVMEASMRGASVHHGLTIGILPGDNAQASSPYAQIRIVTGMGSARNNINVLTSHVIVVCGMASGTASEVSLALRANKRIIFLR
ncbi:MAG TPA: TIGR00725 family protein, partial [Cyclobacteriaceae bacterium]|nr:TIGR00725 family protein [Cyclobacteriaceae bacterium]